MSTTSSSTHPFQPGAPRPTGANSLEAAWPVREVNAKIKGWIDRLGQIWVEGQITQLQVKPNWSMVYMTLRDPQADASVSVIFSAQQYRALPVPLKDGDQVVVLAKPDFYVGRGSFSLRASEIRAVGVGELLASIERLRQQLGAEGLFAPERKQPLPFLPKRIGLITGRGSAAEQDVLSVSQARWPGVQFEIINTAVQGPRAVPEIIEALQRLDAQPEVEVIIIARGGGSVEDLLPFSQEALVRAVSKARTPVVSAIGHEPDSPVLDNVADLRAATPTDAAKKVVPDVAAEIAYVQELRGRAAQALMGRIGHERHQLEALRSRPVLMDPLRPIAMQREIVERERATLRRELAVLIRGETSVIDSLRSQVATLGPAATLARGYSIVQVIPRGEKEPQVLTTITQSPPGSQLRIRVADGSISAAAMQTRPAD